MEQVKSKIKILIVCLIVVISIVVAIFIGSYIETELKSQAVNTIRSTIIESAKQCAAIEGSYPSTLSYLEDNYGLILNHNDYIIYYEAFGENILPSVMVIPR